MNAHAERLIRLYEGFVDCFVRDEVERLALMREFKTLLNRAIGHGGKVTK